MRFSFVISRKLLPFQKKGRNAKAVRAGNMNKITKWSIPCPSSLKAVGSVPRHAMRLAVLHVCERQ